MSRYRSAAVVLVLLVAGCSPSPPPRPGASVSGSTPAQSPEAVLGVAAGSVPVIAELKGLAIPDAPGDAMTVGVKSLRLDANGKTITLRLVFTPAFSSVDPGAVVRLADITPGRQVLPVLLDRAHLKRYRVLGRDDRTGWLSTDGSAGAVDGRSFEAWFVFAAPQDPVSVVEVSVIDAWPPFTDVPVQR